MLHHAHILPIRLNIRFGQMHAPMIKGSICGSKHQILYATNLVLRHQMIVNFHLLLSLLGKSFPGILVNTIGHSWMLISVSPTKSSQALSLMLLIKTSSSCAGFDRYWNAFCKFDQLWWQIFRYLSHLTKILLSWVVFGLNGTARIYSTPSKYVTACFASINGRATQEHVPVK